MTESTENPLKHILGDDAPDPNSAAERAKAGQEAAKASGFLDSGTTVTPPGETNEKDPGPPSPPQQTKPKRAEDFSDEWSRVAFNLPDALMADFEEMLDEIKKERGYRPALSWIILKLWKEAGGSVHDRYLIPDRRRTKRDDQTRPLTMSIKEWLRKRE